MKVLRLGGLYGQYCRMLAHCTEIVQQGAVARSNQNPPSIERNAYSHGKGRIIDDDYATIRSKYRAPKHAVVLAHGLMGFDELRLAGGLLPGIKYWRGIAESLNANGVEVITTSVSAIGSIEQRAAMLSRAIERQAYGKSVNIIAHSMGGLDSRYMISQMHPPNVKVVSLTTIATPHHGSSFADFLFERLGGHNIPRIYKVMDKLGLEHGAFGQLTRSYMRDEFNPKTPDHPDVRYFSYGAALYPGWWSVFHLSHKIISKVEGVNDGLVSIASARWGGRDSYKGTLVNVSHLDLINWTNRLRLLFQELTGNKRKFNAIAFYLSIAGGFFEHQLFKFSFEADMLAEEGL